MVIVNTSYLRLPCQYDGVEWVLQEKVRIQNSTWAKVQKHVQKKSNQK